MNPSANLILIGPMGAGKTTLGRKLAGALRLHFIDLDHEIERQSGAPVALIFDLEGEPGFRDRESRLLDQHTQTQGVVLATGGGAVLRASNRALLKQRGFVVYLRTSVETQWNRLRRDRSRPLLRTPDPIARLQELAQERNEIYAATADFSFDALDIAGGLSAKLLLRDLEVVWNRVCLPC